MNRLTPRLARRLGALVVLIACLLPSAAAEAFCGFYVSGAEGEMFNNATQVVLMRDGTRTVLSMQNHYDGPPEDFALVIPVPVVLQEENVKTLARDLFDRVDAMAAPRLVEYWEVNPCWDQVYIDELTGAIDDNDGAVFGGAKPDAALVRIEAQFEVGEYEIVILSADDSMALDAWLRQQKYNIPASAEPVLKPYVESGMKFFVAKVNLEKVEKVDGRAVLSPLRFFYDSDTFSLPVRLGLLNAKGAQDLIIHILARGQRYEVANMPNATIPTNIEVHDTVKTRFAEFYVALFDETLKKNPGAVITEYSWAANTCDPCPGATLDGGDFLSLGADTLPGQPTGDLVLTRLHARYTAAELKDDLIFKAAAPIIGGREVGTEAGLEKGATASSVNNFQGRYIIRHPWEGKIECAEPIRGRWAGPHGMDSPPGAAAVEETAFAPRGAATLKDLIAEDVAELGIAANKKRKP